MRGSNKYGSIFVITLVIAIVYGANGVVTVNYAYERQVGGHIRNAFEVNTPEAMISELNKSVAGMHAIGLTNDLYAAYFPWEQTPDRSMAFQYEYIDQLINRTEAVITWRTLAYSGNSTPETLGDVYEQKMDNLRSFMIESCTERYVCTDWIARDVYYLNRATPYYFSGLFWGGATILFLMSGALFVIVRGMEVSDRVGSLGRLGRARSEVGWLYRWAILPGLALGGVLMALPFILGALGP